MKQIISAVLAFFAMLGSTCLLINRIVFFEWNAVSSVPAEIVFCLIAVLVGLIWTPIAKKVAFSGYKVYVTSFCTITILWLLFTWHLSYDLQYVGVIPQFIDSAFVIPAGISHLALMGVWHTKKTK